MIAARFEPDPPLSAPPRVSHLPVEEDKGALLLQFGHSADAYVVRAAVTQAMLQLEGPAIPPYLRGLSRAGVAELQDRWPDRWPAPCKDMFDFLAANFPTDLLAMIDSGGLDVVQLTLAAEKANLVADHDAVRSVLIPLLADSRAVVRGGAIYGLHDHVNDQVRAMLEELAKTDPSDGVKQAAVDALLEL